MTEDATAGVREAVGVFAAEDTLQAAIDDLESHGFDRAEISLLASENTVERKLGRRYRKVQELEDDPEVPRTCYVSRESLGAAEGSLLGAPLYAGATAGAAGAAVISGGSLLAALAGATVAGGAGALVGGALARLLGERYAQRLNEQLEHGGLLLWVRTWNTEDEMHAVEILRRHAGEDVHVHGGIPTGTADAGSVTTFVHRT